MPPKRVRALEPEDKSTARAWCITLFIPDGCTPVVNEENDIDDDENEIIDQPVRYAIWQREVAPETGRIHWQGYVEFVKPVRPTAILKALRVRRGDQRLRGLRQQEVHWERRRGGRESARDYCRKQESRDPRDGSGPFEWGTDCAGERSDLRAACDQVRDGASLAAVAEEHPTTYVRNYKGLASLRGLLKPVRGDWRGPRCVWYLWGASGTGKTRLAHERPGGVFTPLCAGKGTVWWDNYSDQETILFDDIRADDIRLKDVLNWCDGRDFVAPVKGGTVGVRAHTVIFTSNDPPRHVWPGLDLAPLERRLTWECQFLPNGVRKNIKGSMTCDHGHGHEVGPGNTQEPEAPQVQPRQEQPAPPSPELLEILDDELLVRAYPQDWPEVVWVPQ
nr:MAG: replication associated protein [Arizlama virus]